MFVNLNVSVRNDECGHNCMNRHVNYIKHSFTLRYTNIDIHLRKGMCILAKIYVKVFKFTYLYIKNDVMAALYSNALKCDECGPSS